jgi:hypothetical protein
MMRAFIIGLAVTAWTLPVFSQGQAIEGAQARASSVPKGPAPRTAGGHPDLSGLWSPERNFIYNIESALAPGEKLPIQEWAARLAAERLSKDDPEAHCLPTGVPRQAPYPWRILQTPEYVYFLFEGNIHSYRQIFMDRPHTEDPDPTWYGESVAHWEGDTLVVDTIGFNELFWFDFAGHPHTKQLHVIERFRRPDLGHLEYDVTIDDPGAYTRPFVMHGKSTLETRTELMEYICNENNQDVEHIVGKDTRR